VLSHGRSWDIQVGSAITQTEHPLRIQIWPLAGAPLLVLTSYYPALVGHATVARLMESYRATLERIAQGPERRLGELVAAAVPR
jgi:hypothetical protein